LDQDALMESDLLIAVDENDVLVPRVQVSKRQGHTFSEESPRAVLHRAFSLFLFNAKGEMLLTRRADSKIVRSVCDSYVQSAAPKCSF
jgi:isopentenyl-diphosphate delta-isomerase